MHACRLFRSVGPLCFLPPGRAGRVARPSGAALLLLLSASLSSLCLSCLSLPAEDSSRQEGNPPIVAGTAPQGTGVVLLPLVGPLPRETLRGIGTCEAAVSEL